MGLMLSSSEVMDKKRDARAGFVHPSGHQDDKPFGAYPLQGPAYHHNYITPNIGEKFTLLASFLYLFLDKS